MGLRKRPKSHAGERPRGDCCTDAGSAGERDGSRSRKSSVKGPCKHPAPFENMLIFMFLPWQSSVQVRQLIKGKNHFITNSPSRYWEKIS